MFASRTLEDLRQRKLLLRSRIAARRAEIARAIRPVVRVLVWLDVARLLWRRLPALAKLAGGVLVATAPVEGKWRRLRCWFPLILSIVRLARPGRAFRSARVATRSPPLPDKPKHAHDFAQSAERVST